jgi:hypothetical protein
VDRIPLLVFLNGQDGWAFRIGRVIFQNFGIQSPSHDLPNGNTIGREFLITVFRDPDLPFPEKFKDSVPCFTHAAILTSYTIFIKMIGLGRETRIIGKNLERYAATHSEPLLSTDLLCPPGF